MDVQRGNIGMFEDGGGNEDVLDASGRLCNAEEDGGGLLGLDKRAVVASPRRRKRGGR